MNLYRPPTPMPRVNSCPPWGSVPQQRAASWLVADEVAEDGTFNEEAV
jgi:hypothetical protein